MLKLNFNRIVVAVVTTTVAFSLIIAYSLSLDIAYANVNSEGFIITDYNVDVTVTEDRVYRITENISCNFNDYRHGIFRSIPTSFRVNRPDGSSSKMSCHVKNFKANTDWDVDTDYEVSNSSGNYYTVKLGNADETVIGFKQYTISYDYVCSPDTLENVDEFYFNIIGDAWNTEIEHVSFNVKMPTKFDADKVGFSMGYYGKVGVPAGELVSAVEGNIISGETLRALNPGEALTIRAELPDGYFIVDNSIKNLLGYIVVVFLALASLLLCFKWGRDDKIIPVVQFRPPEGYNSLDVGVIDHLDPRETDALSLLIYLADKGYIAIEPIPDRHGNVDNAKKFKFHKVREYDGTNVCEREFLDGLFGGGTTVYSKDLKNHFYETIENICFMEKEFTSKLVWRKGRIPITLFILASIAILFIPSWEYGGFFEYIFSLYGPNRIAFLIGIACIVVMLFCWGFIQRRTPLGVELAGQTRGFAEFIETAEKDRIEQLIEEDPESFYKIIPYAMVLGISDKWIEKFKGITLSRPSWYMYDTPYLDGYIIGHMISTSLQDTMEKAATAPESSGGGGFSGGGAGGGGGGSW